MENQAPPYEVRCERCRVSFPVGTRRCIHCGERIGRGRPLRAAPPRTAGAPPPPPPILDEMEEEVPSRGGFMSPVAILWIALILASAVYRACS